MSAKVTLKVLTGRLRGEEYVFDSHTLCTVGRSRDCGLRVPDDAVHADVSRRHCLLDIDPPAVRVRDLGSRNGTRVNGRLIGQRDEGWTAEEADPWDGAEYALKEGDEIELGHTVFRVVISSDTNDTEETASAAPKWREHGQPAKRPREFAGIGS
jgi:pSer/pThr/pTyr-binding forkhead associated (FHA) protein